MIVGLDHVQLAMPPGSEDKARHFYGYLLGLAEIEKPGPLQARGGCWFAGQGVAVHLGVQADFVPARKAHPAFLVQDAQGLFGHLREANVLVEWDNSLPGIHRFYAFDPFGNRLEFMQDGHGFNQRAG